MIHREYHDGVAVLRMEHGKANAVDSDLFDELGERLDEVESDASVRALVLTGTGSIFSAGVDLEKAATGGLAYLEGFLPKLSDGVLRLFELPLPVVAAVNGHAIAGGLVLALACDHRVAAEDRGKLGLTELLVGVPFPVTPLEIVRHVVPGRTVNDLVTSARLVGPAEARDLGLVDETVPGDDVLDRAIAVAAKRGEIPLETWAITKRQLIEPTVECIARRRLESDPEVLDAWSKPETLERMQRFLDAATKGRGKQQDRGRTQ